MLCPIITAINLIEVQLNPPNSYRQGNLGKPVENNLSKTTRRKQLVENTRRKTRRKATRRKFSGLTKIDP